MGFDFEYAENAVIVNKTSESEPMTFEKALDNSYERVEEQIKAFTRGDINGKNDRPKPSNWFRQDTTGQWLVHWRISNKPVFFTPKIKKKKGWMAIKEKESVDAALKLLKEEVKSGRHDTALREAFDRKPARKKEQAES